MQNKPSDLNNHLFAVIEKLLDDDLENEKLVQEIARAKTVCDVAGQIIANKRLVLDAIKAADELPGIKSQVLLG